MLKIGIVTSLVLVTVLAYLLFIFISNRTNPFKGPKRYLAGQSRWRFARNLSFIFLLSSYVVLFIGYYSEASLTSVILGTAALTILFSALPVFNYYRRLSRNLCVEETETSSPVPLTEIAAEQSAAEQSAAEFAVDPIAESDLSIASSQNAPGSGTLPSSANALQAIEPPNAQLEKQAVEQVNIAPEITVSEEYDLELELATAHINPNLVDLDQSIAEAEFQDVLSTELDVAELNVAQPIPAAYANDSIDGTTSERLQREVDSIESEYRHSDSSPEAHLTAEGNAELFHRIKTQDALISALQTSNQSLVQAREQLIGNVSNLELTVKKTKAIARQNLVLKEQADRVKVKALQIATMERKKRKLSEIRAQKAIIKLQRSIRELRQLPEGKEITA